MKTIWTWSYEIEASRIAFACANIANGFYQQQGYTVLPFNTPTPTPNTTIFLPDINYSSIPRYWETVSQVDFKQTKPLKLQAISPLIKPLVYRLKLSNADINPSHPIQPLWQRYGSELIIELCSHININKTGLKLLTIHPSSYGSNASFDPISNTSNADIKIELRVDQGLRTLLSAIALALLTPHLTKKHRATWKQIKFLTDWLTTDSPLGRHIDKIESKILRSDTNTLALKQVNASAFQKSKAFLAKIGAPLVDDTKLVATSDEVIYKNKKILYLTKREKDILSTLLRSHPNITTYEDIGDLIFSSPEEYSLSVLSKVIQHLRDKLEKNGLPAGLVKTVYGKGLLIR